MVAGKHSRKGKKAWRRNVDVSAEEVAYTTAKRQQRLTQPLASAADSDLFVVDQVGDQDVRSRVKADRYADIRSKPTHVDLVLEQNTMIKPIVARAASGRDQARRRQAQLRAVVAKKQRVAKTKRVQQSKAAPEAGQDQGALWDLWDTEAPQNKVPVKDEVVELVEELHRKRPKRAPNSLGVSAVKSDKIAPEDGESWNPSFDGHQDLLGGALAQTLYRQERAARYRRVLERGLRKGERASKESQEQQDPGFEFSDDEVGGSDDGDEDEDDQAVGQGVGPRTMRAGSDNDDDDHDDDDDDNDDDDDDDDDDSEDEVAGDQDGQSSKRAGEHERKTRTMRNRERRGRKNARKIKAAAEARRRDRQVNAIGEIVATVERQARRQALAAEERAEARAQRRPRLGRHKFVEPMPELKLSDELPATLRELVPEGSLAVEQLRKFQRAGKLEVIKKGQRPRGRKNRLMKVVTKRSHRLEQ